MTETRPLDALEMRDDFASRHIGPTLKDVESMLEVIGVPTIQDLLDRTVPASIRHDEPIALDPALTEREAVETLRAMADRNRPLVSMIGMGYYGTVTPPVVLRNVLENPAWYTAYTPYQAEVSQGRLEALLNFQQMVMDLTGMDLANASLLDEATAAAEAMAMARRVSKSKSPRFFVDADCHPQTIAVVRTRAAPLGIDVTVGDPFGAFEGDAFGVLIQYPGSSGALRDPTPIVERVHAAKGLAIFATDCSRRASSSRRARSAPTWWSEAPSDSGSRWGSAAPTPRSSRPAMRTSARRPDGSSASRSTHKGALRCAWRCRPASSTFGARRRPPTSALPRCCSR